jgi:hypothetical protein
MIAPARHGIPHAPAPGGRTLSWQATPQRGGEKSKDDQEDQGRNRDAGWDVESLREDARRDTLLSSSGESR